jgi:adenylate cyclase
MALTILRFGSLVLDLDRLCLRGPAGEIELRPKSFEVLRHLMQNPGRVLSKEELMAAIWPDVTVTDDSLTRCISEVRRAIGAEGPHIVRTVPRRGYLFDAQVSRESDLAKRRPGELNASPTGKKLGKVESTDSPFIVVLPFANLSGRAEEEYFCDGITEDIITELSRFSELRVIARHSSFQYKGRDFDVRHVGRDLGVRYVLEGSVRRSGDRVRVTTQPITPSRAGGLKGNRQRRL